MNYQFEYDFRRDYEKSNIWLSAGSFLFGVLLLIGSVIFVLRVDGYLTLLCIPNLLLALKFILFAINGNHPLIKEGQCYLKVTDQKIYTKLGKYAPAKEIIIDQVNKIKIEEQLITLTLKNEKKTFLDLNIIQNKDKKNHFIQFIDKLKP